MKMPRGITVAELLIGVTVLALALFFLCYTVIRQREEARRTKCGLNLQSLGIQVTIYMGDLGDNSFYHWPAGRAGCGSAANPNFGGAEWLAHLYWMKMIRDPNEFLCPGSSDGNRDGADLGRDGCPGGRPLSPGAVSYAAFGDTSAGIYMASKMDMGPTQATSKHPIYLRYKPPRDAPMACDDTEEPINHGRAGNGGMNVLFFDSHVEWWTHERVDLERGVGTGELVHLRN